MAPSLLVVEEYLASGDDRLLEALFRVDGKGLKAFGERWYRDRRPFARRALLEYVGDGCERPGHRLLVKTLFKLAEAAGDDEAIAHFLVAFDRLVRRQLVQRFQRDPQTGAWFEGPALVEDHSIRLRAAQDRERPFSRLTRQYLQRRALRYVRALARKDPERYARTALLALGLYDDAAFQNPAQLLSAWGLLHLLFRRSPVLERGPRAFRLAPGAALAELEPAPMAPEIWRGRTLELVELLGRSRCRTVRLAVVRLLEREHGPALAQLPVARLEPLLASPHDEVQLLGAKLLEHAPGLATLPLGVWLTLLRIDGAALPLVCRLVALHVAPSRLDLAQCVELACAPAAPVAELGLAWARGRKVSDADLQLLLRLAAAPVRSVREQAVDWLVSLLEASRAATLEQVRDLVDSPHGDVRRRALALLGTDPRFADRPELWAAMAESPHDDVRAVLVERLSGAEDRFAAGTLRHLWATTLLAVHRGGRAKRAATVQLADRIVARPAEAGSLLPLLAVALRSVRPPERRVALASLARAAVVAPPLREALAAHLPELRLLSLEPVS